MYFSREEQTQSDQHRNQHTKEHNNKNIFITNVIINLIVLVFFPAFKNISDVHTPPLAPWTKTVSPAFACNLQKSEIDLGITII